MSSVSEGYSATDTFLDDRIDAVRQRAYAKECLSFVNVFRCRTVFELLTPKVDRNYRNWVPKSVFWKSDPLTEKFQNFATNLRFVRAMNSCQVSVEIAKAELAKPMGGIHDEKIIEKL